MKSFLCITFSLWFILCPYSKAFAKGNATWIKSTYFRGYDPVTKNNLTSKDVESLALKLKANHIRYAYIFAGPYENDGHLPNYAFSQKAKDSIATLKRIYPDLLVLPWIGGIQNKTVHLERSSWVKNAIADTVKLIKTMPIDGVHLDFEYILFPDNKSNHKKLSTNNYGEHWIKFHKQLRLVLPKAFISGVVVSTAPGTRPWKHKHSLNEIKELSSVANQVSFMFYETSLMDRKAYRENLKEQIQQIKNLKSIDQNSSEYLIALGIFSEEKKLQSYRDLGFQNLPATLKILQEVEQEINQKKPIIGGLAIYCEWMTTDFEWNQLRGYLER